MENENKPNSWKKKLLLLAFLIFFVVSSFGGAVADRLFGLRPLDRFFPRNQIFESTDGSVKVIREDSVVIDVFKKASPAVVTITVNTPKQRILQFDPFQGFGIEERGGAQDLATGFIVSHDGLVVTNKHVVAETGLTYKVVTKDGQEYDVKNIYRDPLNDIALLKVEAGNLPTVELGDSSSLQVGQTAIAIGTPLGEFRTTVTAGIVSGLGRGINAGNPYEGLVERLDNVIQTDAAINPGNSGGPLLNSAGQVIGVNVAVAAGAENIGFAIPINVVKDSINQFKETGEFTRPYLGVQYQIINRDSALRLEIPEGAYVEEVIEDSAAEKAGIQKGDIITKFGGEKIDEEKGGLAALVNKKKVGETVDVEIWRDEKSQTIKVTLDKSS